MGALLLVGRLFLLCLLALSLDYLLVLFIEVFNNFLSLLNTFVTQRRKAATLFMGTS